MTTSLPYRRIVSTAATSAATLNPIAAEHRTGDTAARRHERDRRGGLGCTLEEHDPDAQVHSCKSRERGCVEHRQRLYEDGDRHDAQRPEERRLVEGSRDRAGRGEQADGDQRRAHQGQAQRVMEQTRARGRVGAGLGQEAARRLGDAERGHEAGDAPYAEAERELPEALWPERAQQVQRDDGDEPGRGELDDERKRRVTADAVTGAGAVLSGIGVGARATGGGPLRLRTTRGRIRTGPHGAGAVR